MSGAGNGYGTISIHAPVKGATHPVQRQAHTKGISIHAPVKGATGHGYAHAAAHAHFNPRSREGSDVTLTIRYNRDGSISIHAPVKGATRTTIRTMTPISHFNPRSREGSDQLSSVPELLGC